MSDKRGTNEEFIKNQWDSGKSGNPNGRPKSFLRKFKDAYEERYKEFGEPPPTKKEIIETLAIIINSTYKDLQDIANDEENAPVYMKIAAEALLSDKAVYMLESILDRVCGKPAQQQVEVSLLDQTLQNVKRIIIEHTNKDQTTAPDDYK